MSRSTVNPNGTGARQVFAGSMECPHWSPDGTELASCGAPQGDDTTILNVDTGNARFLPSLAPGLFSPCYVWAPTGKRLACESTSDADPTLNGIYTVRVRDWKHVRRLTVNSGGDDIPGDYAPDGHHLVFARYFGDQGTPIGLFSVNIATTHLTPLTPPGSDVSSPGDWSPRGDLIVFSRHATPDNRQTLWIVRANGTGLHQIVIRGLPCGGPRANSDSVGCLAPVWSPSGNKIAFLVVDTRGSHLWTANPDGRNGRQIADGVDDSADWGTHPLARRSEQ